MKLLSIALLSSISAMSDKAEGDSLKSIALQEVEITSVRAGSKTPVAYSDLSKEKIESENFGKDIPFLLLLTPSVIATSDAGTGIGYTGFRIRGTDANRINVTTNGIPLNDSESHGVFWVNMPDFASSLEDLQVQRGVGTSTNGAGAFGASINMKTENISRKPFGELTGSYGSFNTSRATVKAGTGAIGNHLAFDGRLSSIRSDGFIDRASVDLNSYFAQGAYFNEHTMVKFITFSGKEKTYHAWDGVPDYVLWGQSPSTGESSRGRVYNPSGYMGDDAEGKPLYYPNQTDNYKQTHYQLSILQIVNPEIKFNVSLHYTLGAGYYEQYKTRRSLKEYGLPPIETDEGFVTKSDLVRQKHLDNEFGGLVFSADYKKRKGTFSIGGSANRYAGSHFGRVTWLGAATDLLRLSPTLSPQAEGSLPHEYYRSKGIKTDMNVYVKGDYSLTENLNIYGDLQLRGIDYSIRGKNDTWDWLSEQMQELDVHENFRFFNPKAGLFYRLNRENIVYGSVAVAHREPNRNNYTDADTNEIPHPERLTDYELGYRFNNNRQAFSANLYYMRYKDQLVLTGKVNAIGEPLTSNVPESYRAGIELTAGIRIFPCLEWNGNLTVSRNIIKNYTEYVTVYGLDGNPEDEQQADFYKTTHIAFSPETIANSLFTFRYRTFSAGFHTNYVGKQYLDNTGRIDENQIYKKERSIDAYWVSNLRLSYDFPRKGWERLSAHVSINNLFNAKYETNGWLWSCYNRQTDGSLEPYVEKNYFPQAGIHAVTKIVLSF